MRVEQLNRALGLRRMTGGDVRGFGNIPGPALDQGMQLALAALSGFYDTLEFRSALTPPMEFNVADLTSDTPPNPIVQWLRPTLTLTGPAGKKVIAPYGEAPPSGALGGFGVVGGVFFAGALAGWLLGRNRK